MAEKEKKSQEEDVGPSILLGLVGAVVVLLLLAGAIWGVGKIISEIRDSDDAAQEEQVVAEEGDTDDQGSADEDGQEDSGDEEVQEQDQGEGSSDDQTEDGDIDGDGATDEADKQEDGEETQSQDDGQEGDEDGTNTGQEERIYAGAWEVNDYQSGDIKGDTHTVVWGDTLWEIAEARYGSGFEWGKIRDANFDIIGHLPNGSKALIIPGQVLTLP